MQTAFALLFTGVSAQRFPVTGNNPPVFGGQDGLVRVNTGGVYQFDKQMGVTFLFGALVAPDGSSTALLPQQVNLAPSGKATAIGRVVKYAGPNAAHGVGGDFHGPVRTAHQRIEDDMATRAITVHDRCTTPECNRVLHSISEGERGLCSSCWVKTLSADQKKAMNRLIASAFNGSSDHEKKAAVDDAFRKNTQRKIRGRPDKRNQPGRPVPPQRHTACLRAHHRGPGTVVAQPHNPEAISPSMLSLRENAVAFCGEQWYDQLNPGAGSHRRGGFQPIREANDTGDSVDVTAFSNITGQIVYYTILEAWKEAEYIGEQLVETRQTDLDGEKMPFITPILANGAKVHPGMPYPLFGVAEEWINTVPLDTYGGRIAVHKLTVFYDRTGQVLKQSGDLGKTLRRNKEFRILDTALAAPGSPLFMWKGLSYAPYQVNGTFWSNDIYSNQLVDWNSFRRVEVASSKILEPDLQAPTSTYPSKSTSTRSWSCPTTSGICSDCCTPRSCVACNCRLRRTR